MMRDEQIDTLLRSLDPADSGASGHTPRSRADLERILAADPAMGEVQNVHPLRRWKVRRGVLIGAAAAVTAGLVALPAISGGDPAYATWTAVPTTLSPAASAKAGDDCRSSEGHSEKDSAERAEVAIAEQRGVWTAVMLTGDDGWSAMCVSDDSMFGGSFGYSGGPGGSPTPEPRDLLPQGIGTGTTQAGNLSMVAGAAGSEVVGVSYLSQTEGEVIGSVAKGQFVLWFPGDELQNYDTDHDGEGVELLVTYADGSSGPVRVGL
ncbi:hypothetical protein H9639_16640 [Arthrobacter sp. Sa2CUA1]|uniref:Uncharacterized protein n=1 Tax=Arthrobacter gallicola TaxID=2762225 RepID=A0ABR8UWK3_9MICC|nr:hypothetical protein [Arthrobacter gallicola]MBD7996922.1 hypothetical protein [Arthrobacter gallicola]